MRTIFLTTAILAATSAAPALAQSQATATTDLNLRAGPGPQHEIVSVIPADGAVTLDGCIEEANWCRVTHDGTEGWAYGAYLTSPVEGEPLVVVENRERVQVPVVEYQYQEGAGASEGAIFGALAGGLLAGPAGLAATGAGVAAGVAAGAATGAVAGDAATPDFEGRIRTYVIENPVEPVYLEGEVVRGAGVPQEVDLYPIPETQYSYLYVNGNQVVVDNQTRAIVHIVR